MLLRGHGKRPVRDAPGAKAADNRSGGGLEVAGRDLAHQAVVLDVERDTGNVDNLGKEYSVGDNRFILVEV